MPAKGTKDTRGLRYIRSLFFAIYLTLLNRLNIAEVLKKAIDSKRDFAMEMRFIASDIIKKHGADIDVESKPEKGTIIWFSLPIDEA